MLLKLIPEFLSLYAISLPAPGTVYANTTALINPSGGTGIGGSGYANAVANGFSSYTANSLLVAVLARAEYATNGLQMKPL